MLVILNFKNSKCARAYSDLSLEFISMASVNRKGVSGVTFTVPLTNPDLAIAAIHNVEVFLQFFSHGLDSVKLESGQPGSVGATYVGQVKTANGGLLCGTAASQAELRYTLREVDTTSLMWETAIYTTCLNQNVNDLFPTTASVVTNKDGTSVLNIVQKGGPNVTVGAGVFGALSFCCTGPCCLCAFALGLHCMYNSQNEDHNERLGRLLQYLTMKDCATLERADDVPIASPEQVQDPVSL